MRLSIRKLKNIINETAVNNPQPADEKALKLILLDRISSTVKEYAEFIASESMNDAFDAVGQQALGNLDLEHPGWSNRVET